MCVAKRSKTRQYNMYRILLLTIQNIILLRTIITTIIIIIIIIIITATMFNNNIRLYKYRVIEIAVIKKKNNARRCGESRDWSSDERRCECGASRSSAGVARRVINLPLSTTTTTTTTAKAAAAFKVFFFFCFSQVFNDGSGGVNKIICVRTADAFGWHCDNIIIFAGFSETGSAAARPTVGGRARGVRWPRLIRSHHRRTPANGVEVRCGRPRPIAVDCRRRCCRRVRV